LASSLFRELALARRRPLQMALKPAAAAAAAAGVDARLPSRRRFGSKYYT